MEHNLPQRDSDMLYSSLSGSNLTTIFYAGMGVNDFRYFNPEQFANKVPSDVIEVRHPAFSDNYPNKGLVTDENSKQQIQDGLDCGLKNYDKDLILAGHSFSSPLVLRAINSLDNYVNPEQKRRIKGAIIAAPFTSASEVLETAYPSWFWKAAYQIGQHLPSWVPAPYSYAHPKKHLDSEIELEPYMGAVSIIKARTARFALALKAEEHIDSLDLPILMLLTQKDKIVPFKAQRALAEKIAEKNKKSTTIETLASGHNLFWDAPEETNRIIKEWVDRDIKKEN